MVRSAQSTTDQIIVDKWRGSDLDGGVRAAFVFLVFQILLVALLFGGGGCATSQAADPRLGAVEVDATLTHAVLILENPSPRPVEVLLRRPGMLRQFVVPPAAAMRQLLPAGPLLVLWTDGRVQLTLRERTRNQLTLTPSGNK
ncbi:MAG: hypothetical protein CVU59_04260 [Deltaproteobacteria bacterium HGW-Deltaproteobacteria-17]|nr:MAG: hypothetical protein CVU59_04260 [Deltaproteobacteria bacterium HGW-Deltaproteobacteria-17]